jgi:hypothetical protein
MFKVVQSGIADYGRVKVTRYSLFKICWFAECGFQQNLHLRQIVARQYAAFPSRSILSILNLLVVADKQVVDDVFSSFFSP